MKIQHSGIRGALMALLILAALAGTPAAADSHLENPTVAAAADILPPAMLKGPNHSVRAAVHNDGLMYIYDVDTRYGPLRAVSTATLYKRIAELNAMSRMEQLKGTKEFQQGISDKAGDFVQGGVGLVTHPVDSVSGAVSGVASIFKSVGGTMKYGKSETESGRLSVISGFDKTKREYAAEFGVDPYSRNEYLQNELNEISRAGFLGSSIVRLGTTAVSGGAGIALSVTGNVEALNDLLKQKSAGDLRVMNEKSLQAMGVSADVSELFLKNRNFTISQQTALVLSLNSMSGTTNRAAFIKFAALTDNADMAAFRQRQADMYATYNKEVAPIKNFEYIRELAIARNDKGAAVLCAPTDRLLWTEPVAAVAGSMSLHLDGAADLKGRELWVPGVVSQATGKQMEAWGWRIEQRSLSPVTGN